MKKRAMACTGSWPAAAAFPPGAAVVKINQAITTIRQQGLDAQNSRVIGTLELVDPRAGHRTDRLPHHAAAGRMGRGHDLEPGWQIHEIDDG
jgi:hypothetical protein